MLDDWLPAHCARLTPYSGDKFITEFIECLLALEDPGLMQRFWSIIAEQGIQDPEVSRVLAKTAVLLPWSDVVECATAAIELSANKALGACIALLYALSAGEEPVESALLKNAAHTLFRALPGDADRFSDLSLRERNHRAVTADEVADTLLCFSRVDPALAEKTLDYMIAWPAVYGIDQKLLPATQSIAISGLNNDIPVVVRLRQIVITHLQTRLTKLLTPPANWSRNPALKCSCTDCNALSLFLKDPDQSCWPFKASQNRRDHLQRSIKNSLCDIDCVTDKKGRPYSLICTKNSASYQRRVEQSRNDQEALARLAAV